MEIIERRKRVREKIIEHASDWASKLSLKVTELMPESPLLQWGMNRVDKFK